MALLLVAVLHFIRDDEDPAGIVARLHDALAPGSYPVISHATADFRPEVAKVTAVYDRAAAPLVVRSRVEIERLFDGFELVEPGLVQPAEWRADDASSSSGVGGFYCGVGRRRRAGRAEHGTVQRR